MKDVVQATTVGVGCFSLMLFTAGMLSLLFALSWCGLPPRVTIINESERDIGPIVIYGPRRNWKNTFDVVKSHSKRSVLLSGDALIGETSDAIKFEGPFGPISKDADVYFGDTTSIGKEQVTFTPRSNLTIESASQDN